MDKESPFFKSRIAMVFSVRDFPGGSNGKASAYNVGDPGSISGLGRSFGEGNGNPLQYSCLENTMDRQPGMLQSMGLQRIGHNLATKQQLILYLHLYKFELFFIFSMYLLNAFLYLLEHTEYKNNSFSKLIYESCHLCLLISFFSHYFPAFKTGMIDFTSLRVLYSFLFS